MISALECRELADGYRDHAMRAEARDTAHLLTNVAHTLICLAVQLEVLENEEHRSLHLSRKVTALR